MLVPPSERFSVMVIAVMGSGGGCCIDFVVVDFVVGFVGFVVGFVAIGFVVVVVVGCVDTGGDFSLCRVLW